jgi:hypothetical protein
MGHMVFMNEQVLPTAQIPNKNALSYLSSGGAVPNRLELGPGLE